MSTSDGYLSSIDHIVVLVMENRSFDNVLGLLYDRNNPDPRFKAPPPGQTFNGVIEFPAGTLKAEASNPDSAGKRHAFAEVSVLTDPNPDAGEVYQDIFAQFYYGQFPEAAPPPPEDAAEIPNTQEVPQMQGFITNYAAEIAAYNRKHPLSHAATDPVTILSGYRPASLPVLAGLAHGYCVCDNWFSSIPSQTFTNRSFIHAGTSSGYVNNVLGFLKFFENDTPTIFNLLEDGGVSWGIYYSSYLHLCNAYLTQRQIRPFHHGIERSKNRFWHLKRFLDEARSGDLPSYSFVEPNFVNSLIYGAENDMHPPYVTPWRHELGYSSLAAGDQLLQEVHDALFGDGSGSRDDTLLIVTFDEHGGIYDHVPPPNTISPDGVKQPRNNFDFNRLGARVPTLLISPRIQQGLVDHTQFEHSSIPATVLERFLPGSVAGAPLGRRVAQAPPIPAALLEGDPETERPEMAPRPVGQPPAPSESALSDFQRAMLGAAGQACGLGSSEMEELMTIGDAAAAEARVEAFDRQAGVVP